MGGGSFWKMMNFPRPSPKIVKAGLVGAFGISAASNSYFDVKEGQQAFVVNSVTGVKDEIYYPGRHYMIPWLESPAIFDVPRKGVCVNPTALEGPFSKALKNFWRSVCDKADSIDINTSFMRSFGPRMAFAQEAQFSQVPAHEAVRSSLIKKKAELKDEFWATVVKDKLGGTTSTDNSPDVEEAEKNTVVLNKKLCSGKKFKDRAKSYALSPEEIFEMWMVDCDKVYLHEREKRKRFKIFKENLEETDIYEVENHGLNCFADMTFEEFKDKRLSKTIILLP